MSADLNAITQFLYVEADLLDRKDYYAWLALWDPSGTYIVPIDRQATNYADHLNYAYDDNAMRRMRIKRLTSGESVSARSASTTIRIVSRICRLDDDHQGNVQVRCAQALAEFRNGKSAHHAADVTFKLRPLGDSFRILEKVVLFGNSTDALAGMTFLP